MDIRTLDAIELIANNDAEPEAITILMQTYTKKAEAQRLQLLEAKSSLRAIQKIHNNGGAGAKDAIDALINP